MSITSQPTLSDRARGKQPIDIVSISGNVTDEDINPYRAGGADNKEFGGYPAPLREDELMDGDIVGDDDVLTVNMVKKLVASMPKTTETEQSTIETLLSFLLSADYNSMKTFLLLISLKGSELVLPVDSAIDEYLLDHWNIFTTEEGAANASQWATG